MVCTHLRERNNRGSTRSWLERPGEFLPGTPVCDLEVIQWPRPVNTVPIA